VYKSLQLIFIDVYWAKTFQGELIMNNKNSGMIATIATVIFCGCPGLLMCIFGAVTATGNMPYNTQVNGATSSGTLPVGAGLGMLCFSLILILIPVAVAFFTRSKKTEIEAPAAGSDPTPPSAS
jgi:hypothetical protein